MRNNQKIIQSDELDMLLILLPSGWSEFLLYIHGRSFNYVITHVFNNPYSEIMYAVLDLIQDKWETEFIWYNEPGGCKFEIKRIKDKQHKAIISVYDFEESYGGQLNFKLEIQFEIKIKQFVLLCYLQLKKTYLLLNDKEFSDKRSGAFLVQNFHDFERKVEDFLKKKQMIF
ncbi:hypothetical protein H9Q08_01405 [Chryseobacterium sp. PS-8]|uniref:Uncharacterized protein n=1 Tax=Chryseobacterium indicum TaxID=2766954 RepID=A0ABS9C176_9FLAO|nr:hypothetical protein [Chryseobacterium sp. PS-8]MCF2217958.1 hypothetical protein [Chryseobacterium sp. PS-8]